MNHCQFDNSPCNMYTATEILQNSSFKSVFQQNFKAQKTKMSPPALFGPCCINGPASHNRLGTCKCKEDSLVQMEGGMGALENGRQGQWEE